MPGPPAVVATAPGRVNLIGEHTDYNGGFVLPTAIPQHTRVELSRRSDTTVTARSANAQPEATYQLGNEAAAHQWFDYVQGITWAVQHAGHSLTSGFDVNIESDVPLGGGLSSSASLEVALLRALRQAFDLDLDDVALARLGQVAENDFVGARCGIMDQMSASLADTHAALFLDTRSLEHRRIPLPDQADLVVIHSGVSHTIAEGAGVQSEYNARRADCEQAAQLLGVPQLRDLTSADLPRLSALPERLQRRARHVITEDERVLEAVDALEARDLARLGSLFFASHASMRDDFEVSTPEIDLLVDLARQDPDVYGGRLTGGGFGGAVVILARAGAGRAVGQRLARAYSDRSGQSPTVLVPTT
jgi:galactokinase